MSKPLTYRLKSDVRYRLVEEQCIVIRQGDGEVLVLNEIGGVILRQIENLASREEIVTELARVYDADSDQLEADMLQFVQEMVEAAVLESTA